MEQTVRKCVTPTVVGPKTHVITLPGLVSQGVTLDTRERCASPVRTLEP